MVKLTGEDGALTPLIKQLTEAAMKAELENHLAESSAPNRKNGKSTKTVKGPTGAFELETHRDRAGAFERKIFALFALGNSDPDIRAHIADM